LVVYLSGNNMTTIQAQW